MKGTFYFFSYTGMSTLHGGTALCKREHITFPAIASDRDSLMIRGFPPSRE